MSRNDGFQGWIALQELREHLKSHGDSAQCRVRDLDFLTRKEEIPCDQYSFFGNVDHQILLGMEPRHMIKIQGQVTHSESQMVLEGELRRNELVSGSGFLQEPTVGPGPPGGLQGLRRSGLQLGEQTLPVLHPSFTVIEEVGKAPCRLVQWASVQGNRRPTTGVFAMRGSKTHSYEEPVRGAFR